MPFRNHSLETDPTWTEVFDRHLGVRLDVAADFRTTRFVAEDIRRTPDQPPSTPFDQDWTVPPETLTGRSFHVSNPPLIVLRRNLCTFICCCGLPPPPSSADISTTTHSIDFMIAAGRSPFIKNSKGLVV